MTDNLVEVLEHLDDKQKAVLHWCIAHNADEALRKQYHKGLLPFIKRSTALRCVREEVATRPTRLVRGLLSALDVKESVTFRAYLDDGRMAKLFGSTMERGRRIAGPRKPQVKVKSGFGWKTITLDHTVSAKFISKGEWEINCAASQRGYVVGWLEQFAGKYRERRW